MIVSDDFIDVTEHEGGGNVPPRTYPTFFGVTLTPQVSGILIGVGGVVASMVLFAYLFQPAWKNFQELREKVDTAKVDIKREQKSREELAEAQASLGNAQQQRRLLQSLFASEQTLDTLLLDINDQVRQTQASLKTFSPDPEVELIEDGSLGASLNGKLKRQKVTVGLLGDFNQIYDSLQSIERLQPLLLVKNIRVEQTEASQTLILDEAGNVIPPEEPVPPLEASWDMEVVIPRSSEELAAEAQALQAQEAEKGAKPGARNQNQTQKPAK